MTLLTKDITTILKGGGTLKFDSQLDKWTAQIETSTGDAVVENCYNKMKLKATTGNKTITMTRVKNDAVDNNCIDIRTIDSVSAIGAVTIPGYVYTGNFSGCVFYLYKTGSSEVTGVHAYSGMVTETTKRWLRKPKITQVVREFGPIDYYTRNPAQQICRYPTRGQLDIAGGETSLSFLACVENTKATTFLFSVKDSGPNVGYRVMRLLETHEADF